MRGSGRKRKCQILLVVKVTKTLEDFKPIRALRLEEIWKENCLTSFLIVSNFDELWMKALQTFTIEDTGLSLNKFVIHPQHAQATTHIDSNCTLTSKQNTWVIIDLHVTMFGMIYNEVLCLQKVLFNLFNCYLA